MSIDLKAARDHLREVDAARARLAALVPELGLGQGPADPSTEHLRAALAFLLELSTTVEQAREACARRSYRLGQGDDCEHCVRLASIHARIEASR